MPVTVPICGAPLTKNWTALAPLAVAVIVANNAPGDPINMGGSDPSIVIPAVMVSQADGAARISAAGRSALGKLVADVRHGLDQAPLRTSGELLYA